MYEFDEFSNVALHGWSTLRDQVLDAMEPTIGILIYRSLKTNELDPTKDLLAPDEFNLERFLTQLDLTGALSYAMEAKVNQHTIVLTHLKLARAIEAQINEPLNN